MAYNKYWLLSLKFVFVVEIQAIGDYSISKINIDIVTMEVLRYASIASEVAVIKFADERTNFF